VKSKEGKTRWFTNLADFYEEGCYLKSAVDIDDDDGDDDDDDVNT
jgi:hypothetical protein